PSPYAVTKLRETVRANHIGNVTVCESALGDYEGEGELFLPPTSYNKNHTPNMVERGGRPHRVRVETLDGFLESKGIACVDLLKMDVEGFEPNIVRGAACSFAVRRIKAVLCEFNDHWLLRNQSSSRALFARLSLSGFQVVGGNFDARASLQNLLLKLPA
ncbi:MAG: FkbM family methyltransferase, partial [Acidobacteria bacterium]|nr:FkbM family methyltransferase [Acidobacteriota bacterium]